MSSGVIKIFTSDVNSSKACQQDEQGSMDPITEWNRKALNGLVERRRRYNSMEELISSVPHCRVGEVEHLWKAENAYVPVGRVRARYGITGTLTKHES